jgi:biopolymer transport protein ExbD
MRRQQRKPPETPQEPTINITPLIDVVFVVLIAFIVIAPLLNMDKVQLAKGSRMHSSIHFDDASPIQIHVHGDNTIALNEQEVDLDELTRLLAIAKERNPKAKPQLFHDKKAYFGTYQEVKNRCELVGFEQLDIVLSPT